MINAETESRCSRIVPLKVRKKRNYFKANLSSGENRTKVYRKHERHNFVVNFIIGEIAFSQHGLKKWCPRFRTYDAKYLVQLNSGGSIRERGSKIRTEKYKMSTSQSAEERRDSSKIFGCNKKKPLVNKLGRDRRVWGRNLFPLIINTT